MEQNTYLWNGWARQTQLLWRSHLCNKTPAPNYLVPKILTASLKELEAPSIAGKHGPCMVVECHLAYEMLTRKQGPSLPASQLQLLHVQALNGRSFCCPFSPKRKETKEVTCPSQQNSTLAQDVPTLTV